MNKSATLITARRIANDPQLTTAEKIEKLTRFQVRYANRHDYDTKVGNELMGLIQSLIEDLYFERQFDAVDELGPERAE